MGESRILFIVISVQVMHFRGVNAKLPGRFCKMQAIRRAGPQANYYLARKSASGNGVDYDALELRHHHEIMEQALEVDQGASKAARDRAGRQVGINGQNLMKQLLGLWKGTYKATMMTGDAAIDEEHVLSERQWDLIDREVAESTKLVPAQIAPSLTSVTERGYWNADSYAYFMMYLGPIVLKNRLPLRYYRHFVDLSELVQLTTQMEITSAGLERIESGFVEWVQQFEQTVVADFTIGSIRNFCLQQGPPCHYWCYTMERYGGWVKREVLNNRKRPIEALNTRVLNQEQISQVLSTIEQPDELVAWMNAVTSLSMDWSTETADEKERHSHVGYRGRLVDAEKGGYVPSIKVLRALAKHMETEEWTAARQMSNSLVRYSVGAIKEEAVNLKSWRSFKASNAQSRCTWRTKRSCRESGDSRDTSWANFRQVHDTRAKYSSGEAVWKVTERWGEIQEFLSFDWEGTTRCVAVIMPCREDTVNWIPGRPKGTGPQFVKADNRSRPLQVVDVKALITIAGGVPRPGLKGIIVFDTSRGLLDPELLNV
ncbi:hypothetical protein QFC20_006427 [Naganishia adeliensis]|uniref:Uncharacterized protein n=1 Tax=Naganishia adeliensis TaxID=92952 RepID=A0ACC2VBD0_9TREE|nr:hypothetical protein QFC20_006427 [Naganishia adeliensis]